MALKFVHPEVYNRYMQLCREEQDRFCKEAKIHWVDISHEAVKTIKAIARHRTATEAYDNNIAIYKMIGE
jgi:hypothetical protein